MTSWDDDDDAELRAAMRGLEPFDTQPPLETISARTRQIAFRRRARVGAFLGGATLVLAAAVAAASPSPSANGRVQTQPDQTPTTHARHIETPSSTIVAGPTTTVLTPATVVAPSTTLAPVSSPTTAPTPVSVPATPVTTRPTAPTTTTVPSVPAPVRVTFILDDQGLHGPASIAASGEVDIIWRDQRSAAVAQQDPWPWVQITAPGYTTQEIRAYWDNDRYGNFGAIWQVDHVSGTVQLQALDKKFGTNLDNGYATLTVVAGH
jgi:hypothetical protein